MWMDLTVACVCGGGVSPIPPPREQLAPDTGSVRCRQFAFKFSEDSAEYSRVFCGEFYTNQYVASNRRRST